jgi:deoxyadenosine/deoxycytidine kinase
MTRLPEKYRYIVVEGPIGVGKTSLARKLAEVIGASTLLEDPAANPFLPKFYQDRARYALPTQLFFLFQRVNQVRDLGQADFFNRATVADFILDKDPLFARLTLTDDELNLYQQIYNLALLLECLYQGLRTFHVSAQASPQPRTFLLLSMP